MVNAGKSSALSSTDAWVATVSASADNENGASTPSTSQPRTLRESPKLLKLLMTPFPQMVVIRKRNKLLFANDTEGKSGVQQD